MLSFKHNYLYVRNVDLEIERQQLIDEGRELADVYMEFDLLAQTDLALDSAHQLRASALLDRGSQLPTPPDYPYVEPFDLESIRRARSTSNWHVEQTLDEDVLFDKILGAWLGRCAGCLLGKPVEGLRSKQIWGYLQDLGRFPLDDFFRSDVPEEIFSKYEIPRDRAYIDRVSHMVEDDDLDYTVTALAVMKQHGINFTSVDVANFWMQNLPILCTFTAGRAAYRNFCQLIAPPESALFRNPYREWVGGRIRADFWGYVALGNPQLAAELAWRDASISHAKNGVYSAMWVAAILAAAPFIENLRQLIEIGLGEIPQRSRLVANVREVIQWHQAGLDYDEAIQRIHARWNESNPYHWCHSLSNAQILTIALLWGEGDYEKSICRAVQACFDTDCNSATAGSIVGMMLGAKALPAKWIRPLNDTLETGVRGYNLVRISDLARETVKLKAPREITREQI